MQSQLKAIQPIAQELGAQHVIGLGMESILYYLGGGKMMRIYHASLPVDLERMGQFYQWLAQQDLPYKTPEIFEHHQIEQYYYSIERYNVGTSLDLILDLLDSEDKKRVLSYFLDAVYSLSKITPEQNLYGEFVKAEGVQSASWEGFLIKKITNVVHQKKKSFLKAEIESKSLLERVSRDAHRLFETSPPLSLVHGDIFPGNVIVDPNTLQVNALIDFSSMTLKGDSRLDLAAALAYLEIIPGYVPEDSDIMRELLKEKNLELEEELYQLYIIYYSVLFMGDNCDKYPTLPAWCEKNIKAYIA